MDTDLLKFHFNRLFKTLLILSSQAEIQIKELGLHGIPVDFSVNIDCHYVEHRDRFIQSGLLSIDQMESIEKIKVFMLSRSCKDEKDVNYAFWMENTSLEDNPDWEELRSFLTTDINVTTKQNILIPLFWFVDLLKDSGLCFLFYSGEDFYVRFSIKNKQLFRSILIPSIF